MTTLDVDKARTFEIGMRNEHPVVATDIIFEGAAVGLVAASGHARPLTSVDRFVGFAEKQANNLTGLAAAKNVRLVTEGLVQLAVAGIAITDVGRPVYATDDDTFVLTGIGSFIGHVYRYISTGIGIIIFDANRSEEEMIVTIPIALVNIADGDIVTTYMPGFAGRIKSLDFVVGVPVTTADKLSTLNAEIGTTDLTGGTVALTSANCTPLGAIVAGAAITAGAAFKNDDTISIEAASTTAFIEGDGYLLMKLGK